MIWLGLWLAAAIPMIGRHELWPAAAAWGVGIVVALFRSEAVSRQTRVLEQRFTVLYGTPVSTGDLKGTRYGGAAGALVGHYWAGALVGAAVDLFREASARTDVTSEQRRLLDEIMAARSRSPALGLSMLTLGLGAVLVIELLRRV